jgi:hypothetical protein
MLSMLDPIDCYFSRLTFSEKRKQSLMTNYFNPSTVNRNEGRLTQSESVVVVIEDEDEDESSNPSSEVIIMTE